MARREQPGADTAPAAVIALVGPRGVGKSTVAALVARKLGVPWVDLDDVIERRAGRSVVEIFAAPNGEAWFRELEGQALDAMLAGAPAEDSAGIAARAQPPALVLATGAGVVEGEANRRLLRERTFAVNLTASVPTLLARLGEANVARPRLRLALTWEAEVAVVAAERAPLYDAVAWITVSTDESADVSIDEQAAARVDASASMAERELVLASQAEATRSVSVSRSPDSIAAEVAKRVGELASHAEQRGA